MWQIEHPYVPFDYWAKENLTCCQKTHIKRAACYVTILTFLFAICHGAEYFMKVYFDGKALVFFPLLLVCGLILVYGLWTEHPNILISYIVLVAGLLVARMVTVTRVLITLFDPKSNWSLEPTYRAFGVADEKGETVTSYALFHLGYAIFFIVVYVLFIYIVDKCRRYFIRLDEFKESQAHNLTYKR
ncbi:unnamed protein product, partial [Mesorhabditis spiculigera]